MSSKGKQVAYGGKGKGKAGGGGGGYDDDKTSGGGRKQRNREILQFFEDEVDESDGDDDSIFDDIDDFMDEDFEFELQVKKEAPKAQNLPFVPKEEEMDEEEFDRMMEERFKNNPRFATYAEDAYEAKKLLEQDLLMPSSKDPTIWKVKCTVGRERHSAVFLMQKFVELKSLGTKLQIISAFALDHQKGFFYIEAERQSDLNEACKGLSNIYYSRVATVPRNELTHLLAVRNKRGEVTVGMWARVKNGRYKGDLAQIVAVNNMRKRATVKLIPRMDLQAMAEKYGGGVALKKAAIPAPRLISSSELEEFRPLIEYRRDRETGKMMEVLDGQMLKDGYLYKRVSLESLSCHGVVPLEEELSKFEHSENDGNDDLEWLTQLYGGRKKKRALGIGNDKGGEKGESSSRPTQSFELYTLVCIGRKDFGLVIGMEKDGYYKILKEGLQGPDVMTCEERALKSGPSDMKFTAFDKHKKSISVSDSIRVLEGPLKDRQGTVRQIYRGVVFVFDENESVNGGYFCCKAQCCEKIKLVLDGCAGKDGELGPVSFEDFPTSPKSSQSPKRLWESTESKRDFSRGNTDSMYSIGQTLRIRVGPLKGYLCHVLAIRYSDVTVKLDSKQKVFTVKSEHLAEVRGKTSFVSASEDLGPGSFKPFDLLGNEGSTRDGAGESADGWNTGGPSAERNGWSSFPASSSKVWGESDHANPSSPANNNAKKDAEDGAWGRTAALNQSSTWGAAAATVGSSRGASDGWGKSRSGNSSTDATTSSNWDTAATEKRVGSWGKTDEAIKAGSCENKRPGDGEDQLNKSSVAAANIGSSNGASDGWGNHGSGNSSADTNTSGWNAAATEKNNVGSWGKADDAVQTGSWENKSWDKNRSGNSTADAAIVSRWDTAATEKQVRSWGKTEEASKARSWGNKSSGNGEDQWNKSSVAANVGSRSGASDGWGNRGSGNSNADTNTSGWNAAATEKNNVGSWGKADDAVQAGSQENKNSDAGKDHWRAASAVSKQDEGSSWNDQKGGSGWSQPDGGSSWNKGIDQESGGWKKASDGGSSTGGKQEGGSAWSKSDGGSWKKDDSDQDKGAWKKETDGGSSTWTKQDGGSSWHKDDRDQDTGGWSNASYGDRGSCGRQGRGGGRGGRGRFGRGRSFDEDRSSGWKNERANNWTGGGASSQDPSSLSSGQGGGGVHQSGGWSSQGGWSKETNPRGETSQDQANSWNPSDDSGGWNQSGKKVNFADDQKGGSGWSQPDGGSSTWGKQEGGSPWSKSDGSSWKKDDRDQDKGAWKKETDGGSSTWTSGWRNASYGGRGSGGRQGRGGGRGGRGRFGRGRSFDEDRSLGWKNERDNNWTGGSASSQNPSSWSSGQGGGGARGGWGSQCSGWSKETSPHGETSQNQGNWKSSDNSGGWNQSGKKVSFADDQGGGWSKGLGSSSQGGGWGGQGSGGNGNGKSSGWNKAEEDQGNKRKSPDFSGGWNQSAKKLTFADDQGSGWNKGEVSTSQGSGWGNHGSKSVGNVQSSGCNSSKEAKEGASQGGATTESWGKALESTWGNNYGDKGQESDAQGGGGWDQSNTSGGSQPSGWNQSKEEAKPRSEQTDSWGKPSASSWENKGNDGSSKGGWGN